MNITPIWVKADLTLIPKWAIVLILFSVAFAAEAQDAQYSQYYAAALYHNPAFAGTSTPQRLCVNYRIQWPGLPAPFVNYSAAFDFSFKKTGTAIGLLASQDVAGISRYKTSSAGLIIAQKVKLNDEFQASLGVQASFETRSVNNSQLVFPDQITRDGIVKATMEPMSAASVNYANFAVGAIIYSQDYWVGMSIHNFNQPSLDPLGGKQNIVYPRATLMGGVKIPLRDNSPNYKNKPIKNALMPSVMYRSQGSVSQLDYGATVDLTEITFGLYGRGLPFVKTAKGVFTQDAIIGMIGLKVNDIRMAYSYDYNVASYLSEFQGAHEISLQIGFNLKDYIKSKRGPCPGMY
jgi:type IX secretion system PorP/SprF family membrane protein